LLDLTRESDDTSLGAELLDEIAPGGGKRRAGGTASGIASPGGTSGINIGTGTGMALAGAERAAAGGGRILGPQIVEAADSLAPAFGGAALAAVIMMFFGALAIAGGVNGTEPTLINTLSGYGFLIVAGIGIVLAIILFIVGLALGKVGR
jgi:hypothetical protein